MVFVLSGGNIDMNRVSRIIDRGLEADGRVARLVVRAPDRPGSLAGLTRVLADEGANVFETAHRRAFADINVGEVEIVTLVRSGTESKLTPIMLGRDLSRRRAKQWLS